MLRAHTKIKKKEREKASGEIILEDVDPHVFEIAMKFQQDSKAIRTMSKFDALNLVAFYDNGEIEKAHLISKQHQKAHIN